MKTILCLGDSITDADRLYSSNGLGYGYVSLLQNNVNKNSINWKIINKGFDGFTCNKILNIAEKECQKYHPDITTILVGINDIALIMNTNRNTEQQQNMIKTFEINYEKLIQKVECYTTESIILLEPFIFPYPAIFTNWIPYVNELSKIIETLSNKYHCTYIKLQNLLNSAAQKSAFSEITIDGVHLTPIGHEMIAQQLSSIILEKHSN